MSEAKTFAIAYLAGLKVASERDMKGKVIIQTRTKFSTFKQNRNFREWLDGSETAPVRPKIMMTRTDLPGNVRVSAGFFFNVVARHDTAKNFQKQINDSLSASGSATGTIPDFQIEVFTSGGDGGRSRLYRMFASSVQNVSILTEKMAMIMPKPSMDIFYIPQKVWTALEASKKKEYLVMQAEFDKSHNSRVLTGLKNTKLQLPRATAGGAKAESAQGFSIYTWLTRVQANNGYTMFPKVFECDNGDVELWFHMSHEKEAGAWMSTALAEIARLSGIELVSNRRSAEAMFVNPDKVWTSLDKLNNGVSLPAQRSVYMDFSPPMGIVTFPTRPNMSRRQRKRPSQLQLVFDIEAASTVSVITTDDTRSKASRKSRRNGAHGPKSETSTTAPTATSGPSPAGAEDDGRIAAAAAAKLAIQTADAAVAKHPPKFKTVHHGLYITVPDKFGNQLPVVLIDGKWVPLTVESLLESRRKAPPMNYGVVARMPQQGTNKSSPTVASTATLPTQQTVQEGLKGQDLKGPSAQAATVTPQVSTQGNVSALGTSINAKTDVERNIIKLSPPTQFGTGKSNNSVSTSTKQHYIKARVDGSQHSGDVNSYGDIDDDMDNASYASYDARSTMSASTAGQSIVTFAQITNCQAYDIADTPDAVMLHSDATKAEMHYHGTSALTKLESKTKKGKKKSSLQAAVIQAAIDRRAAIDQSTKQGKPTIRPPSRDSSGRPQFDSASSPGTKPSNSELIASMKEANAKGQLTSMFASTEEESAVMTMVKNMAQELKRINTENAELRNRLEELTLAHFPMEERQGSFPQARVFGQPITSIDGVTLPYEQIDRIENSTQPCMAMVAWSPPQEKRRSKKTTLQPEVCRSPPRGPPGTPQMKKKTRRTESPSVNRFGALASTSPDNSDVDMDSGDDDDLAKVEAKLDNLKIRYTHIAPDSTKRDGAGRTK